MPDAEQLGIMCLFGLLLALYVFGLAIRYLMEYWHVVLLTVVGLVALRHWYRRGRPLDAWDDEDLEPVPQE